MAVIHIKLSGRVHARVKRRATERGYPNVAAYLTSLVDDDLKRPDDVAQRVSQPAAELIRDAKTLGQGILLPTRARKTMIARPTESIRKIRKRLLDGMVSYMKASDDPGYGYVCGFRLKHIDRCASIIDAFLAKLSEGPKPPRLLEEIKRTVVKLNRLNASCDGALIETDQREDLCQLILLAAQQAGLDADQGIRPVDGAKTKPKGKAPHALWLNEWRS